MVFSERRPSDYPKRWEGHQALQVPSRRILLVEDNPDFAVMVEELLSGSITAQYDVERVGNLEEAIRTVADKATEIDAVLLDLSLPDSDTRRTISAIDRMADRTPVIVLSANGDTAVAAAAVKHGAQDFLVKGNFVGYQLSRAILLACERFRSAAIARRESLYDELTGLLSLRGFSRIAFEYAKLVRESGGEIRVAFADVDGLKAVNDTHGHEIGSQLIRDAATVLTMTFRQHDVVARWGGDEFVALLVNPHGVPNAKLYERMEHQVHAFTEHSPRPYPLSISMGFSRDCADPRVELNTLVREADGEMYKVKKARP